MIKNIKFRLNSFRISLFFGLNTNQGFLSSTWKRHKLKILQQNLNVKMIEKAIKQKPVIKCSCCKVGNLHTILNFDKRGPPAWYIRVCQSDVLHKS